MARPYEYETIHTSPAGIGGKERITVGSTRMFGVKYRNAKDEYWVGKVIQCELTGTRKYQKMFFTNRTSAQTQCDKLNELYNAAEYRVVEVAER